MYRFTYNFTNEINMRLKWIPVLLLFLVAACGPGWDGYDENYSEVMPISTAPWEGDEIVYVVLDETEVEVALEGLQTHDYLSAPAVSLSELIVKSALTPNPESYVYAFTATDDYNLFVKR